MAEKEFRQRLLSIFEDALLAARQIAGVAGNPDKQQEVLDRLHIQAPELFFSRVAVVARELIRVNGELEKLGAHPAKPRPVSPDDHES